MSIYPSNDLLLFTHVWNLRFQKEDVHYTHRYRVLEGLSTDTTYRVCLSAKSINGHEVGVHVQQFLEQVNIVD